jgi:hypothetical protein
MLLRASGSKATSQEMDGTEPKKNSTFFAKTLDFWRNLCYNKDTERDTELTERKEP